MDFDIRHVPTAHIDIEDLSFRVTTDADKRDLKPSLSSAGLIQPPLLIENGGRLTIVCGFRRVLACHELSWPAIPSRILPAGTDPIACVRTAIADNAFQRPLNIVEQARAYALIRNHAEAPSAWKNIAASAGLPESSTIMDRLLPVAQMPAAVQTAILDDRIALPIALEIHRMERDDAAVLCAFFMRISASLNVQRELLQLITEIARRDGVAIAQLLGRADIEALLDDNEIPTPQKVQRLRRRFKLARFPELSRMEETYRRSMKQLQLDPHIQLQPPQFFEGRTYRLTLNVDSRRQLRTLQSDLEKLIDHPDLLPE